MSNKRFELEQIYLAAKAAYYDGEPIMSDDEFDRLEQELIELGSTAHLIVGADDRKAKFSHPSPMLSLAKFQATLDGTPPTEQAERWMANTKAKKFEVTPKFDGNAANVIYTNGKLVQILSRGNGLLGRDITDKVKHNVPETISLQGTVEIRGEVCISIMKFNTKYSTFKNPRNLVAGCLNRDDNPAETIHDLDFIPVEVRQILNGETVYHTVDVISGLKHKPFITEINESQSFQTVFQIMTDYRENLSDYQLDGFVIKTPTEFRADLGENSHDPNWAIAIKFPPKEAITKIIGISWQFGKTGKVTPVAIMEPVDLDGTTVSRASLCNYGFLKNKGAVIGSIVSIAKAGDIIPQIQNVLSTPSEIHIEHPTHCKCGSELVIKDIHLMCINPDCSSKAKSKFHMGVNILGIDGVGGSMINSLWDAGIRNSLDLLNPNIANKEYLINAGIKDSKILDNMLKEIQKITDIHPIKIILSMGIDGMGNTIAKELQKYLTGQSYSFHGLQKDVITGFEEGGWKRNRYNDLAAEVSKWINIIQPETISEDSIAFEMSGSPKAFGYKTKDEFVAAAKLKGYHHTSLSSAKVLFVEDVNNLSGKIKAAQSKGVQIKCYSEI
jgi:DNA ligase (NAD+)